MEPQPLTGEAFRGFVIARLEDIDRRLENIEKANGHASRAPTMIAGGSGVGVIALIVLEVVRAL